MEWKPAILAILAILAFLLLDTVATLHNMAFILHT